MIFSSYNSGCCDCGTAALLFRTVGVTTGVTGLGTGTGAGIGAGATGKGAGEVFSYLRGKIDKQLYVHVAQLLNSVVDINLLGDEDLMSPSYKSINPTRSEIDDFRSPYKTDAPSTYNRKPQPIAQQLQDDPRDKKKNWVKESKTFFLLKNLILETLDESKKEELKSKFPQFADKIDFLSSNGVVGTELQWATKQLNNSDAEDILKNIQNFINNKQKLKIKDINQYKSLDDLKSSLENRELSGKEKEKKEKASAQTFFNDENFALIRPRSTNSSCYYGSNTKWCISAKEGNRFAEYSRQDAKFYFIISNSFKVCINRVFIWVFITSPIKFYFFKRFIYFT